MDPAEKKAKYDAEVAAYFRGERETFPQNS